MSLSTTMRGSCSTAWPSAMPSAIGSPWIKAGERLLELDARVLAPATAPETEVLGDDHRGGLQHLDVLVGVFLARRFWTTSTPSVVPPRWIGTASIEW